MKLSNLHSRILSALVLIPVTLGAVYLGGVAYAVVVMAVMGLGFYEWLRLVNADVSRDVKIFAFAALFGTLLIGAATTAACGAMAGIPLTLLLFWWSVRQHDRQAGWVALGLPYMAGSGLALLFLRADPNGLRDITYLLLVVWGTDIGGYILGKTVGGVRLAPTISPNKTWAGLGGGMALAAALGCGIAVWFGAAHLGIATGLALVLAVVSQLGDLFESWVKRRAGVKESGFLIPGHGGILDRIDGLISAALFLAVFRLATADGPLRLWDWMGS